MVIGMTVVLGKVMPWKGKVAIGMTGETEKVMLEKGKVAIGMTVVLGKVMPWKEKAAIGMTGELGKVMPWKGKVAIGMTAAASHTSKRKKQEMTCAEPLPGGSKLPRCTRQKEKSKKWRVRSRPPAAPNCRVAHAKKKKARNAVCGAAPKQP